MLNPQTNETVGVLASTYDLSGIQRDIGLANDQLDAAVLLLSPDGRVIAGSPGRTSVDRVDTGTAGHGGAGQRGSGPDDRRRPGGRGALAAHGHRPWSTATRCGRWASRSRSATRRRDALAEVTRSTEVATLVGLLAIALGVIAATAAARPITRPIEALTSTAAAIAAGDLEQRASPAGPAELSTLAEAFNTLTARLRTLISGLQEQVAQRTGQLEARVEQLATLNRITQTVSSMRDLETAPPVVTQELVELFDAQYSGIALSDGERCARSMWSPSMRGRGRRSSGRRPRSSRWPSNPSSAQVIGERQGRSS